MYYEMKVRKEVVNISNVESLRVHEDTTSQRQNRFFISIGYASGRSIIVNYLIEEDANKYYEEIRNLLLTTE